MRGHSQGNFHWKWCAFALAMLWAPVMPSVAAAQAKATCKTDEVYARMAELRGRIDLYDKRVADAQVDVAGAEAEIFVAEQTLKTAADKTAEERKAAVEKAEKKSLDEYRKEYQAYLKKVGDKGADSLTDDNVKLYKQIKVSMAGDLPADLTAKVRTAKGKLEEAQGRLRRASRELRDTRKELADLEKLPDCPKSQTSVPMAPVQVFPKIPVHFFAGLEGGGGWSNTTFATTPNFDVNGTGGVFGVNAGFLVDIPGTAVSMGARFGWLGSNVSGRTEHPPASPFFDYEVKTRNTFYQEVLVRVPIGSGALRVAEDASPRPQDRVFLNYNYFATASLGVAQVNNEVIGTSGAFRVTDSYTRTGATVSIGLGMPIFQTPGGVTIDLTGQYRAVFLPAVDVNIPGKVGNEFWQQGLTFGLDFRY